MPVGSFKKYLLNFTSDHTHQSATFESETVDGKKIALTVMTWDLLNKGRSAAMTGGHSNNPFDLDETDAAYLIRKKKQFTSILKRISSGEVDVILLQEVDVFTKSNPPRPLEEEMALQFFAKLNKLGWDRLYSKVDEHKVPHPLVTLYDTKKLEKISKRGVFPTHAGLNRGFEVEFKHLATEAIICVTNIYLDDKTDHTKDITDYQNQQIEAGKLTIIGGDTNPGKDVVYHGLVGDVNMATSIASPSEVNPLRNVGFMAGPAHIGTKIIIKEWISRFFKVRPRNVLLKALDVKRGRGEVLAGFLTVKIMPNAKHLSHNLHQSWEGKPWRRKLLSEGLQGPSSTPT